MAPEYPDLTSFKALSFDCYGTLIDWATGFLSVVRLLTAELPAGHALAGEEPPIKAMQQLNALTRRIEEEHPGMPYNEILVKTLSDWAGGLGVPVPDSLAEPFGNAPGTWAAFPDTIEGLLKLQKHYKLIILSNVDNTNIRATVERQLAPAQFAAVYTAQDIGSYKPSHQNFEYLFGHARKELGIDKDRGDLLHVAHSLTADHVPAKELGLRSVWISRGEENGPKKGTSGDCIALKDKVAYEWRFDTIGDFANEVERQFAAK